jgi:hypothetical protein
LLPSRGVIFVKDMDVSDHTQSTGASNGTSPAGITNGGLTAELLAEQSTAEQFEAGTQIRRGRGRARKTIDLLDAAYRVLADIQPASVRAVCYQLFTLRRIASMSKVETNRISRLLTDARERGEVLWSWIVDETREAERIATWDDPADYIDAVRCSYRKNRWTSQPERIEVWSEKGTIRGILAPVLNEYGVTFRVMHGHGSATAVFAAAEESRGSDKPTIVLYVGDWDPSGMHMSEVDLPERIGRYGGDIKIIRVALIEEDTFPEAGVASFPASDKVKDPRFKWFVTNYGDRCFELDALNPNTLRDRIEQVVRARLDLDLDAWDYAARIEAAEFDSMAAFFAKWPVSGAAT